MIETAANFGQNFNAFMHNIELDSGDLLNKLISVVNPNIQYAPVIIEILKSRIGNVSFVL